MSEKPVLRLDWCSYAAAQYAVTHWHYSKSLPTPPVVKIGVWEAGAFIGCVLFSRGANRNLGNPYGLVVTEVAELTRVALARHSTPVSRILTISIKMLRIHCPRLRLIISYADSNHGHHGGIYQAGNFLYCGSTPQSYMYKDPHGRVWHQRQVSVSGVKPQYGTLRHVAKITDCEKITQLGKHRYLYPLDAAMRAQITPLMQPYPKRASSSQATPADQAGEGGAAPPLALSKVL